MSVQCPAGGCDYTGHLDAVEGHIGGVSEGHEGLVPADLRKSLDGKASEGVAVALLMALLVAGIMLYLVGRSDESDTDTSEDEPVGGVEPTEIGS